MTRCFKTVILTNNSWCVQYVQTKPQSLWNFIFVRQRRRIWGNFKISCWAQQKFWFTIFAIVRVCDVCLRKIRKTSEWMRKAQENCCKFVTIIVEFASSSWSGWDQSVCLSWICNKRLDRSSWAPFLTGELWYVCTSEAFKLKLQSFKDKRK